MADRPKAEHTGNSSPAQFQEHPTGMPLDEISANFELLDDWEDRYRYVMELGRALPPLDEALRTDANKVRGCASQVWLYSSLRPDPQGGPPHMYFVGDSDAHIVRGLVAILIELFDDHSPTEVLNIDAHAAFDQLGLKEHLTPQRSNGLASMIRRIEADATAAAQTVS